MDSNLPINTSVSNFAGTLGSVATTASSCAPENVGIVNAFCRLSSPTEQPATSGQTVMYLPALEDIFPNMTTIGSLSSLFGQLQQNLGFRGSMCRGKPSTGEGTILQPNGVLEKGKWIQGIPEGLFTFRNPNGSIWKGEYHQGKLLFGEGTLLQPNGVLETGKWVAGGLRDGPFTFENPNNSTWKGEFHQGRLMCGEGTLLRPNGVLETGKWVEGLRHGLFTIINPKTDSTWTGEYCRGQIRSGEGILVLTGVECKRLRDLYAERIRANESTSSSSSSSAPSSSLSNKRPRAD